MDERTGRYDTIDVLRGLSIIAVVLHHCGIRFSFGEPPAHLSLPPWLLQLVVSNGGNGVTVFFAVSGFLIATTAMKRFGTLTGMRPARFYRVRFARIAPLLLTLLAVLSVLDLAGVAGFVVRAQRQTLMGALAAALTFHINVYEAAHGYLPANWDVMWSLSTEEMFYLFFPLVCVAVVKLRRWWVFVLLLLALTVVGPFARVAGGGHSLWNEYTWWNGASGIALGVLTALPLPWVYTPGADRVPRRSVLIALQALGGVLISLIALWPRWHWIRPELRFLAHSGLDDTLLAAATCLVMAASVLLQTRGSRVLAPVRWFGRHSYEVYLTHEFVVIGGTELYLHLRRGWVGLWFSAILVVAGVLGWVVARWFSEPMNRWLRGRDAGQKETPLSADAR